MSTSQKAKITNWTYVIGNVQFWHVDFARALSRYLKICELYNMEPDQTKIRCVTTYINLDGEAK